PSASAPSPLAPRRDLLARRCDGQMPSPPDGARTVWSQTDCQQWFGTDASREGSRGGNSSGAAIRNIEEQRCLVSPETSDPVPRLQGHSLLQGSANYLGTPRQAEGSARRRYSPDIRIRCQRHARLVFEARAAGWALAPQRLPS